MERLKELENFLNLLPFSHKKDENKEIEFDSNQKNNNKNLNKKRKREKQRQKQKNKNNNFQYDPDKKTNLLELQEKLRAKIESFKTNKGKRTQKKEQKRIQQENDKQKNNEMKEKKEIKDNENKIKQNKDNIQNKENNKNKTPEKDANNKDDEEKDLHLEDIELEKNDENENNIDEHQSDSNININEEIEKKNLEKNDEYSNSIQSSFKAKIIDNSQMTSSNVSQKYQNLNLTQTSSGFNYLFPNKNNFEVIIPCQEENLILEKSNEEVLEISKQNDIEIIENEMSYKNKLIKNINEIDINTFVGKDELKNMEKKLEILLNNIRIKLGDNSEKTEIENILEKYSIMLLDKIENGLNKNK